MKYFGVCVRSFRPLRFSGLGLRVSDSKVSGPRFRVSLQSSGLWDVSACRRVLIQHGAMEHKAQSTP